MLTRISLITNTCLALAMAGVAWSFASLPLGIAAVSFGLVSIVGAVFLYLQKKPAETEREMISMVALYKRLPFLDENVLANLAGRAWGIEFEIGDEAQTFVAGRSPLFVIKTDTRMYTVNHFDRPYFDNVDEVVDELTEMRMRHVLETHQSWISVDLMSDSSDIDVHTEYSLIGRLLNQMVNQDGLAILIPQQMRLIPWDDSVESALTSNDPLSGLSSTNPPVVPVLDDNPKMTEAVELAQSNWPQFESAFENHMRNENRDESRKFSVKAPISYAGSTEYIWLIVTSIENQIIYGTLANQPIALGDLAEGDRARVPAGQLNDWVYTEGDQMVGGFTIKVLADLANQNSKE